MTSSVAVAWHAQRELVKAGPASYVIGAALTVCAGVLPSLAAWATAGLLGALASGAALASWTVGICGALLLGAALPRVAELSLSDLSRRLRAHMQVQFFRHINEIPTLSPFEDTRFRDRLRLAQQASETAPRSLMDAFTAAAQAALSFVSFFLLSSGVSLPLALLGFLATVPAGWALSREARERVALMWTTTPSERRRSFYGSLLTNLQALKEVRVYGLGNLFTARMDTELQAVLAQERSQEIKATLRGLATALLSAAGIALAVLLMSTAAERPSVQDASVLLASLIGLQASSVALFGRWSDFHHATDTYRIYLDLIRDLPAPASPSDQSLDPRSPQEKPQVPKLDFQVLSLENVSFRYRDDLPWALQNVSIVMERGHSYGLVGKNGAGKSTLVKLILRLYEPTHGRILLDGQDIAELPLPQYRAMMGAVFQDFMNYDLSAWENIAIGDIHRTATLDDVHAAAVISGAHHIAESLPNAWNTMLTRHHEAGDRTSEGSESRPVTLSGGQWQRLAISRAMMRRARPLLVLDEPMSGMDAKAEHELREALSTNCTNQTVIHVSHRLSTIRRCDQILVLSEGRLTESGSHEELMSTAGEYAEFFRLQADGYDDLRPSVA